MSNKVVVMAEARMASSRLPNKSATLLAGKASIVRAVERCQEAFHVDQVIGLFPYGVEDDALEIIGRTEGWDIFRGAIYQATRRIEAHRHFGLDSNDIIVLATGDAPLVYVDWMPDAIELMQEEGYDCADIVFAEGTFAMAVSGTGAIWTVGAFEHGEKHRIRPAMFDAVSAMGYWWDVGRRIIVHLDDPCLKKPWPMAPLSIDYPKQAIVMKRIYEQLYQGQAIDVRDVYRMIMDSPFMQRFIGPVGLQVGVVTGNQPNFPMGFDGTEEAEMKKAPLGWTEISYKGGAYIPKSLPKWEDTIPLYERKET